MRKRFMLGFVALSSLVSAQIGDGVMKAGLWEETAGFAIFAIDEGKAIPLAAPQRSTDKNCYSQEEMRQGAMLVAGSEKTCTATELKMADGKFSMHSTCNIGKDVLEGTFEGTYDATTLHMTGALRSAGPGTILELRAKFDATHVSTSCKPGETL